MPFFPQAWRFMTFLSHACAEIKILTFWMPYFFSPSFFSFSFLFAAQIDLLLGLLAAQKHWHTKPAGAIFLR